MFAHMCAWVCGSYACMSTWVWLHECVFAVCVCVHSMTRESIQNAASTILARMAPSPLMPVFAQTQMKALRPSCLNKLI